MKMILTTPDVSVCGNETSGTLARTKSLAFVLALLIASIAALPALGANWYVDNAAAGSRNGTSWANAWTSLGSVVWGSSGVKPGDTLFISGGSSSKTYTESLTVGAAGSSDSLRVTIRVGQDPGHNGKVYVTGGASLNSRHYVTIDGEVNGTRQISVQGNISAASANHFYLRYLEVHTSSIGIGATYGVGGRISYCYLYNIQSEAGIQLNARNYRVAGYDQTLIDNTVISLNRLSSGSGTGPDGIQGCWGLTVDSCTLSNTVGTVSGAQHQDLIQTMANYFTIKNSRFIGSADSCIDYDVFNGQPAHHRIYNNVFILVRGSGIRYYSSTGSWTSITDVQIMNNSFIDHISGHQWAVSFANIVGGALVVSDVAIKNNLFYNCVNPVYIESSSAASQVDWNFDYNLLNAGSSGNVNVTIDGGGYTQVHGFNGVPTFKGYVRASESSDVHLVAGSVGARDQGTTLSQYFSTDKDGLARPQGAAWDIGAYEASSGASTNPIVSVSPSTIDFGSVSVGSTKDLTLTVANSGGGTLAGTAIVLAPFSVVSGGTYSLGSNQTQVVTIRYTPATAGNVQQTITFTGGGGTIASAVGSAWTVMQGLTFPSTAGTVTQPFTASGAGYISQPVQTGLTDGGRAVYGFSVPTAGQYVISINLNAPDGGANSLFVGLDASPTDPACIWDIPVTAGFENRLVAWRGTGTFDAAEFAPKVFNLSAGVHQLSIVGREAGVQIGAIAVTPYVRPAAPRNLRVVSSQ